MDKRISLAHLTPEEKREHFNAYHRAYMKEYRKSPWYKMKQRAYGKKWRAEHPEHLEYARQHSRQWRIDNPDYHSSEQQKQRRRERYHQNKKNENIQPTPKN